MVLHGADGIVFVADATPLRMAENLASLAELRTMLATQGKTLDDFPIVLECNKSDLPEALSPAEISSTLGLDDSAAIRAVAINGEGVFDALRAVSRQVAARL